MRRILLMALLLGGGRAWSPRVLSCVSSPRKNNFSSRLTATTDDDDRADQEQQQQQAKLERLRQASKAAAERYDAERRRSILTAVGSALAGAAGWGVSRFAGVVDAASELPSPSLASLPSSEGGDLAAVLAQSRQATNGGNSNINPVAMLREMERSSLPLPVALRNGRPTVVDFYADWCENCRVMAPRMAEIERAYGGRVNFVTLNGDVSMDFSCWNVFLCS